MSRSNFYNNYYQSFMNENMNPLYRRYLEYLSSDLPDVSDIGGFIDVPTTAEREGLESLLDTTENVRTPLGPMAPMNQQREGGGGPRGTGIFGNLDRDSRRRVLIDGVLTDVYTNLTSGLTQTYDGKNVKGGINTIFDPSNLGGVTLATDEDDDGYDYDYSTFGPSVLGFGSSPFSGVSSIRGTSPFSLDRRREEAIELDFERKEAEKAKKKAAEIEKAKKAMVEKMKQENQKPGQEQGGYQSNFAQDKEFMDGPKDDRPGGGGYGGGKDLGGGGGSPGSSGPGGSDTMGSF